MKPILFSTPMVQAILAGQKTQTRRVVKPQPKAEKFSAIVRCDDFSLARFWSRRPYPRIDDVRARFIPGDILWVRETFRPKSHGMPIGDPYEYRATALEDGNPTDEPWKPSIFMPKKACRLFLKVADVRVERLQSISEADAKAEGVDSVDAFFALWQKINGTESLAANPWVWVCEFEVISKPRASEQQDAVIKTCKCEMPAKIHGKNLCWRCKRSLS